MKLIKVLCRRCPDLDTSLCIFTSLRKIETHIYLLSATFFRNIQHAHNTSVRAFPPTGRSDRLTTAAMSCGLPRLAAACCSLSPLSAATRATTACCRCLPACLPACLSARLLARPPARLPACSGCCCCCYCCCCCCCCYTPLPLLLLRATARCCQAL